MQTNNLDSTSNLFNCFEKINFETPCFSFDNFNLNGVIQMKADYEDDAQVLYNYENSPGLKLFGCLNMDCNEILKLKHQNNVEKDYEIDSEVEYFQNWIIPTQTSTNLTLLKSPFITSGLECDFRELGKLTSNCNNRSLDNFGANVASENKEVIEIHKSQKISEETLNKEINTVINVVQANIDDGADSESNIQQVISENFESCETEKLDNSDFTNKRLGCNKYSERSDVVFKSIFRAIKRYYLDEFKDYLAQHSIKFNSIVFNKKNKADTFDKILVFVKRIFTESNFNSNLSDIDFTTIARYIGRISLPDYVAKTTGGYNLIKETRLFYDCVYNYSHIKAKKLFKSKPIQIIFSHFISSRGLQKMIQSDKNLQNHRDVVMKKANELFSLISD